MHVWQPHTSVVRVDGILEGVFGILLLFYLMVTFSNPQNHSGIPKRKRIPGSQQCPRSHRRKEKQGEEDKEDQGTTARLCTAAVGSADWTHWERHIHFSILAYRDKLYSSIFCRDIMTLHKIF